MSSVGLMHTQNGEYLRDRVASSGLGVHSTDLELGSTVLASSIAPAVGLNSDCACPLAPTPTAVGACKCFWAEN